MNAKKITSLSLTEEEILMLAALAEMAGNTKSAYVARQLRRIYTEHYDLLCLMAALSGRDLRLPDPAREFLDSPKSSEVLAAEEKMRGDLAELTEVEERLAARDLSEGGDDFFAALRRGDLAIVGGKVVATGRTLATRVFADIDIGAATWIHDLTSRKYFKSLNIPEAIKGAHDLRDRSYAIFSLFDGDSGMVLADKRRLRLSSGREIILPVDISGKISKLDRLRVTYHGMV